MTLDELIKALRSQGMGATPEEIERLKSKYRDLGDLDALDKLAENDEDEE